MRTFASAIGLALRVEDPAPGGPGLGLGRRGDEADAEEQAGGDEGTFHGGFLPTMSPVSHAGLR